MISVSRKIYVGNTILRNLFSAWKKTVFTFFYGLFRKRIRVIILCSVWWPKSTQLARQHVQRKIQNSVVNGLICLWFFLSHFVTYPTGELTGHRQRSQGLRAKFLNSIFITEQFIVFTEFLKLTCTTFCYAHSIFLERSFILFQSCRMNCPSWHLKDSRYKARRKS